MTAFHQVFFVTLLVTRGHHMHMKHQ